MYSMIHYKKKFRFFELFRARLVYKYEKSANTVWPQKYFFPIFSILKYKNAKFDAYFESIEKVLVSRKFEGWELFYTVLKDEKVHNFYTFMLLTFFVWYNIFYTFFNGFEISIGFCIFLHPYQNVVKKIIVGHSRTFYQLWILTRTQNGSKIWTIFFSNVNQNELYFSILVSDQQGVKIISPQALLACLAFALYVFDFLYTDWKYKGLLCIIN